MQSVILRVLELSVDWTTVEAEVLKNRERLEYDLDTPVTKVAFGKLRFLFKKVESETSVTGSAGKPTILISDDDVDNRSLETLGVRPV